VSDFDLTEWLKSDHELSEQSTQTVGLVSEEKPKLSQQAVSLLNFCEQTFWETGLLPTPESSSEELGMGIGTVNKWYKDETFRAQLATRGMDPVGLIFPGKLIKESRALSPKQILVANMMLNLHDKRSEREKLAQVQVSSQQYHAWLRQPAFVEFLRKRGEALFSSADFIAYKSLVRNVQAGDNKALELFFSMRGIYNKSINVNLNIDVVLSQVIEVVSRHVTPQVMNLIAGEIESIIEAEVA
jgi:hypothetical protein